MADKNRSVLITGASGFIGSKLLKRLIDEQYANLVLLSRSNQPNFEAAATTIKSVQGDLNQPDSLLEACAGVDTIYHLAGLAHVGANAQELQAINFLGTENLLAAAIKKGVRRLIYFSSSLASDCKAGSETKYGKSKLDAERALLAAQASGHIEAVILRPVNVYGTGMKGNIASMINGIRRRRFPPLPALSNKISLLSVSDLVSVALLAADGERANGSTYTITDGVEYGINQLEEAIYHCIGRKIPALKCPRMVIYAAALGGEITGKLTAGRITIGLRTYRNLVQDNCFSNQKVCEELGFSPSTDFYRELPSIVKALGSL